MKTKFFPMVFAGIAVVFAVSSCGGQKQVVNSGKTEIITPFSSPEYRSDMEYFRATGTGTSKSMEAARSMASMDAREQLAAQVTAVLKSVSERYMNQINVADKAEFSQKFEANTRQVVNQELVGAITKDDKLYQNADGSYEYWVNVEMSRAKIEDGIEAAISKDEKLAVDFDQHLFMKTFDEEMAAFEKRNESR